MVVELEIEGSRVRVLLDSGAEINIMKETVARALNLPIKKADPLKLLGFHGNKTYTTNRTVTAKTRMGVACKPLRYRLVDGKSF